MTGTQLLEAPEVRHQSAELADVVGRITGDKLRSIGLPDEAFSQVRSAEFELPIDPNANYGRRLFTIRADGGRINQAVLSQGEKELFKIGSDTMQASPAEADIDTVQAVAEAIDSARAVSITFKF